ncbi:ladderlectin-like [Mastacembelus armatus]|uniref:ladderlectin-like n=1 Tax=Mastacembelus armatus TaxID=205130 RepID=UPI000E45E600|nr:ladderlectin-like [Mastacembelus armatus]
MKTLILAALLCALLALTTAQGQCPVKPACPSGWTEYCGRCFTYVPRAMAWADAQKNCQTLGANLASVRGAEEYGVIQKVISDSKGTGAAWIGGSDAQQEGSWFWINGDNFKYTNWTPGEPNNQGGAQNCIQMNFAGQKLWDDLQCNAGLPSVCVKNLF